MADEIVATTSEVIDIDEFRRRVLEKVDPRNSDTLGNVSEDIVALANNKELLLSRIVTDISTWRAPEFSMYSTQSCVLDRFGPFTVRINLWPSRSATVGERMALSYNAYHDHNFDFVTTSFFGPGYKTELYARKSPGVAVEVGDRVALEPVGERGIPAGIVVIYRKGVDVHAQKTPAIDSASLNLIVSDEDVLYGDQFYYDPSSGRVIGLVENVVAKRMAMIELGRYIRGPLSGAALRDIQRHSKCFRSRRIADEILEIDSDKLA